MKFGPLLLLSAILSLFQISVARAELADQGLNSIMQIIDRAIDTLTSGDGEGDVQGAVEASDALVRLSRTLGTLSFSRLQCEESDVLAEFTMRVQKVSPEQGNKMRSAFQEGYEKSAAETTLLSDDECERLTRARTRNVATETPDETEETVIEAQRQAEPEPEEEIQEPIELRYIRVAELTGQLAYKRRFCDDEKVFNRDYNEYLESIPESYREAAKQAYWKGYKHGQRLNRNLTPDKC